MRSKSRSIGNAKVGKVSSTKKQKAVDMSTLVDGFGGVFAFIVFLFLFLSLISYSPLDNCFNVAGGDKILNLCGNGGAIVADLLLQYLGVGACVVCFIVFCWSADLLLFKGDFKFPRQFTAMIFAVFFSSVTVGFFKSYNFSMQMLPGGYMGFKCADVFQKWFGFFVGVLFCFSCFLLCFVVAAGLNRSKVLALVRLADYSFVKRFFKIVFDCLRYILSFKFVVILFRRDGVLGVFFKEIFASGATRKKTHVPKLQRVVANNPSKPIVTTNKNKSSSMSIVLESKNKYLPPSINLLQHPSATAYLGEAEIEQNKTKLLSVLKEFGVRGTIVRYSVGPVVVLYELKLEPGTKASRVIGLANDVARTMHVPVVRIADIPSRGVIGVEIPNVQRQDVVLRQVIGSDEYRNNNYNIPIVLGVDIMGKPVVGDLSKMPHLLIAGTTGSGKSVGLNAMIVSILYKLSPDRCKFVMIDPKMLELSLYNNIPHLLTPVITDPAKAIVAMRWVVQEMLRRNKKMSNLSVRNISGYNQKAAIAKMRGSKIVRNIEAGYDPITGKLLMEQVVEDAEEMPYIVVIIDEMADLMMVAGKEMEGLVQRITQMARAAGIHLIMATQRPSVDVITGVIKANLSTRIGYRVASKTDSRIIIEEQGAEQLLGHGDMLYLELGKKSRRVHGPFVSEQEIESITKDLATKYNTDYVDILSAVEDSDANVDSDTAGFSIGSNDDMVYKRAISIVMMDKKTSISYLQRKMRIGYNRAANFIEKMESDGILSSPDSTGKRNIIKKV